MDTLTRPLLNALPLAAFTVVDGSFLAGFLNGLGAPLTIKGLGQMVAALLLGALSQLVQHGFRNRARLAQAARAAVGRYVERQRAKLAPVDGATT